MRIAPMAGHAGDGREHVALIVLVEAKEFLVDPTGHLVHMAGDVLFRLGVAGEIQMMGRAVCGRRMTETAFYTQCCFPAIHDLIQIFVADVLWQDLQILRPLFRWAGGGHSDDRQGRNRDEDCNFLVMKHMGNFGTVS